MKWIVGIVSALVLLVGLAIGAGLWATSGIVRTGDGFFAALRAQDADAAQALMSEGLRMSLGGAGLQQLLADPQLAQVSATSWRSREVNNEQGELRGSLTTAGGGSVPISLRLVREQGDWKVHAIERSEPGFAVANQPVMVPNEDEALALVRRTTTDFSESLMQGDMSYFHARISSVFRQQFSISDLNQAYAALLDLDLDWRILEGYRPILDGPGTLDQDGVLRLTGHFPTEPNQVRFRYSYIEEAGQWQVLGLNLSIQ